MECEICKLDDVPLIRQSFNVYRCEIHNERAATAPTRFQRACAWLSLCIWPSDWALRVLRRYPYERTADENTSVYLRH